jgi:FHA domain
LSSPRSSSVIRAESGPLAGQSFALDRSPFSIGRGAGNALVVPDTLASRQHASLELQGDRWFLRDLGSSNGTFLNRQAVSDSPQPLHSGDLVGIGDSVFVFTTDIQQIPHPRAPAGQPVASQRQRSMWIMAAVIAIVLVIVVVAAVLLVNGLAGKDQDAGATPGLPSLGLPTGLPSLGLPTGVPSAFPSLEVPTGFPTELPLPTGGLSLPTGLPDIPLPGP